MQRQAVATTSGLSKMAMIAHTKLVSTVRVSPGYDKELRAVVTKVDRRIMPLLFLCHVICYLDQTSVAFAALQMNEAIGLSPAEYGLGASIFFITYALLEIPSSVALIRIGARPWIARIMISWGVVTAAMVLVTNAHQFYGLRALLGAAQAGFVPAMVIYVGRWYPSQARARAMATVLCAPAIGSIVAGPLAGAILSIDAYGVVGWQWLFLIEGALAVVFGAGVLAALTERPEDASWLSQKERDILVENVGGTNAGTRAQTFRRVLSSKTLWLFATINFTANAGLFAVELWTPQLLKGIGGLSDADVGLLAAIPNLFAIVGMIAVGWHSDRVDERRWHIAVPVLIGAVGLVVTGASHTLGLTMVGLVLARLSVLSGGPLWCLVSRRVESETGPIGVSVVTTVGVFTGVVWPYVLGSVKDATDSFQIGLNLMAAVLVIAAVIVLVVNAVEKDVSRASVPLTPQSYR